MKPTQNGGGTLQEFKQQLVKAARMYAMCKKAEGRAQQRKADAEEQAAQKEQTRQAEAEADKAEKERDREERKDKGLLGGVSDSLSGRDRR